MIQCKCSTCSRPYNNHEVRAEWVENLSDGPGEPVILQNYYRIVQCMGCGSIKYMTSQLRVDGYGDDEEFGVSVFPDGDSSSPPRHALFDSHDVELPESVQRMYNETVQAVNKGMRTLAALGLRAAVEAICRDKVDKKSSLKEKIKILGERGLLMPNYEELMHGHRELGNEAAHDLSAPSLASLDAGLDVLEHVIAELYVMPKKLDDMRRKS